MTEKRFTYSRCEIFENGEHFSYACSGYNAEEISNKLNELHEENQSYKQNVSKTLQKHYNRLVKLSNNGGEDECGFMTFIKFLSQELDVELEDLE